MEYVKEIARSGAAPAANPAHGDEAVLDCVIGLGSNQGDSLAVLSVAVVALGQLGRLDSVSNLYKTLPVGGPPQRDFLNAAVRLQYGGAPRQLLAAIAAIEDGAGRQRAERWGPRTLDLDMLWAGDICFREADLELPHPRLALRAFALRPLLDVRPDATDPSTGVRYSDLLAALPGGGIEKLSVANWRAGPAGSNRAVWTGLAGDGRSRATAAFHTGSSPSGRLPATQERRRTNTRHDH